MDEAELHSLTFNQESSKDEHGEDGISNFPPMAMLNSDLKILAQILANHLQTDLPSLI